MIMNIIAFGNALSCYVAKLMGVPIGQIICATNSNDIVHRTISRGDISMGKNVEVRLLPLPLSLPLPSLLLTYPLSLFSLPLSLLRTLFFDSLLSSFSFDYIFLSSCSFTFSSFKLITKTLYTICLQYVEVLMTTQPHHQKIKFSIDFPAPYFSSI